jgi:hypothetical protein
VVVDGEVCHESSGSMLRERQYTAIRMPVFPREDS